MTLAACPELAGRHVIMTLPPTPTPIPNPHPNPTPNPKQESLRQRLLESVNHYIELPREAWLGDTCSQLAVRFRVRVIP